MANREQYAATINCKCGKTGDGLFELNLNPVHNNWLLGTIALSVSQGFEIKGKKAFCQNCEREV